MILVLALILGLEAPGCLECLSLQEPWTERRPQRKILKPKLKLMEKEKLKQKLMDLKMRKEKAKH